MGQSGSRLRWAFALILIVAFWSCAKVSDFFLDRPFIYTIFGEWSDNLVRSSARFPNAFEMARYALSWIFLLPAVILVAHTLSAQPEDPLDSLLERLGTTPGRAAFGLAALSVLAASVVGGLVIAGAPLIDDERSYLFQSELFARGRISLPSPPHALQNPMILLTPAWMSKYTPGQALWLLPGTLLGVPHLMPALAAGLLVLSSYALARRAYGERQGLLAAALLAASPFTWCTAGTYMVFATTAAFLTLTLALAAHGEARRSRPAFVAAGAALGFAGLLRPFDAALFSVPLGVWLVRDAIRSRSSRAAGLIAGGLPALAFLLWYNSRTTGHPLRMAYWLAHDFSIGFTRALPGFAYVHTPWQAVGNLGAALLRLDAWTLAWPGGLLLFVLAACLGRRSAWDARLMALLVVHVFGYALIASSGTWDVGPTYYFIVAPLLVMLAVRGVRALRVAAAEVGRVRRFISWLPLAGLAVSVITLTPLFLIRLGALCDEIEAPWQAVTRADPGDSLIVLPPAVELAAAGYSLGYPYELESASGVAHLVRPSSEADLRAARAFLGPRLPVYSLALDREFLRTAGERRYSLVPLSGKPDVRSAPTLSPED